ncbi:MAG: manganese efflux pump [Bacteroidales bacterium]|nr:manganese efflux pump [Bacteroidales bacterium]
MIIEWILLSVALAMDCFTVSVIAGMLAGKRDTRIMLSLAFWFGLFQGLMPLIGWLLTSSFEHYIEAVDHWVAFAMLALIGGKMLWDGIKGEEEDGINPRKFWSRILLAVATSIDALAIGISFACNGYSSVSMMWAPIDIIGAGSFIFSVAGYLIGHKFGAAVNKKIRPSILGGLILIGIGIKILIEHLG